MELTGKAFAYVSIIDGPAPQLLIAWDTVRDTVAAVQAEVNEWFADEEGLIVELEFTAREVKRVPHEFLIRGEPAYQDWLVNRFAEKRLF